MHTIKLKVSNLVYDEFRALVRKLGDSEIEILSESSDGVAETSYLNSELEEIISGEAAFLSLEETEMRLNQVITNSGNPL
jgi:hypothetical protein